MIGRTKFNCFPEAQFLLSFILLFLAGCISPGGFGGGPGNGPRDFSLSITPGSQSVIAGHSTIFQISVNSVNQTGGPVGLSASWQGTGIMVSFSSPPVSTIPGSATLLVTTLPGAVQGDIKLTITGTDFTGSQSITATLTVTPPADFTLSATPADQRVVAGRSVNYTIALASGSNPQTPVSLSTGGLPAGITATFNPPTLSSGSPPSTLTVSTASGPPAGAFNLTVTGTDNSGSNSLSVLVEVFATDFSFGVAPGSFAVNAGGTANYTVSANPIQAPAGDVTLAASGLPPGVTATFSPPTILGATGTSTLSLAIAGSAPLGTSNITVTGSDSTGSHSQGMALVIQPGNPHADFSLAVTPSSQETLIGSEVAYTVHVLGSSTNPVSLGVSGLPPGVSATFSPGSVNGAGTATLIVAIDGTANPGTFTLTITGTDTSGSQSVNVTLQLDLPPPPPPPDP
jgi:hypothetical protein